MILFQCDLACCYSLIGCKILGRMVFWGFVDEQTLECAHVCDVQGLDSFIILQRHRLL